MSDWIKLHRKIIDNPVFSRPNYIAVWIYILCRCNYKKRKIILGNKTHTIEPGSFIGSIRKISEHLNIPLGSCKNILMYLEAERMIEHKPTTKYSLFKVINWEEHQRVERVQVHQQVTRETDKKEKKEKEKTIKEKNIPEWMTDNKLKETWESFIKNRKEIKSPMTDRAKDMMLKKIRTIETNEVIRLLEESIAYGWKGIFPKEEKKQLKLPPV